MIPSSRYIKRSAIGALTKWKHPLAPNLFLSVCWWRYACTILIECLTVSLLYFMRLLWEWWRYSRLTGSPALRWLTKSYRGSTNASVINLSNIWRPSETCCLFIFLHRVMSIVSFTYDSWINKKYENSITKSYFETGVIIVVIKSFKVRSFSQHWFMS